MAPSTKEYTLKQVAEHKAGSDVWMVIHDRVYDVTKFLDEVRQMRASLKTSNPDVWAQ